MELSEELKKIKKIYGEKFMHLCRGLFPTIIENEGTLLQILQSKFSGNSKTLYDDIANNKLEDLFKKYIYSNIDVEKQGMEIIEEKTPYEILNEAGYDLVECTSEEEIQKFKRYYAPGEELCTFNGGRLNSCAVFFAVKKDAENIKREDFERPKREDQYGTSVMGIQFNREGVCTVSIKNRYNHTVNNPDATYGNDLDRIAPNLEQSFKKLLLQRGLQLNNSNKEKFTIPNYVVASDGKYYKYNIIINGIYYCPGNIMIRNRQAEKLDPSKKMLIDNFIIDLENKTIKTAAPNLEDSFTDAFGDIEKIDVQKDKDIKKILIQVKDQELPVEIDTDSENQIIGYHNSNLTKIGNSFLDNNRGLKELDLPNLEKTGYYFLEWNQDLTEITLPKLAEIGADFLYNNRVLKKLYLPNLRKAGNGFLYNNQVLKELDLPNLEKADWNFLYNNESLTEINLPNLKEVDVGFLSDNRALKELYLPNLIKVGDCFLDNNRALKELYLPNLVEVGKQFLYSNQGLKELDLPNLVEVGNQFLYSNQGLKELNLPNLKEVGNCFLENNQNLAEINLPKLEKVGNCFLAFNQELTEITFPNLKEVGDDFLHNHQGLKELYLPNLTKVGNYFLICNEHLTEITLPNLIEAGEEFLYSNESLTEINLPQLEKAGDSFLFSNQDLTNLNCPKLTKIGDDFLHSNKNLAQLKCPSLKEIPKKLLDAIARNQLQNENNEKILNSIDIANLDKNKEVTTSENDKGESFIKTILEKVRGVSR